MPSVVFELSSGLRFLMSCWIEMRSVPRFAVGAGGSAGAPHDSEFTAVTPPPVLVQPASIETMRTATTKCFMFSLNRSFRSGPFAWNRVEALVPPGIRAEPLGGSS